MLLPQWLLMMDAVSVATMAMMEHYCVSWHKLARHKREASSKWLLLECVDPVIPLEIGEQHIKFKA